VVDDQLAAVAEQVREGGLAVLALEDVALVDAHHRQPPPVGVQRIALPGQLLLPYEQLLAGGQPLLARHDLGRLIATSV
jgi:hypothetical protein